MSENDESNTKNEERALSAAGRPRSDVADRLLQMQQQVNPDVAKAYADHRAGLIGDPIVEQLAPPPIPMILWCPMCKARHIDTGEFATKPHHTHSCQACGLTWRPAVVATVGVLYLPGFKDVPLKRENEPKPPRHLLELMRDTKRAQVNELNRQAYELAKMPLPGEPGSEYYSGFFGDIRFTEDHPLYLNAVRLAKKKFGGDARAPYEDIWLRWDPCKSPNYWRIHGANVEGPVMTDEILEFFPAEPVR